MVRSLFLAVFGGHPTPPTPYPTPLNHLSHSVLQPGVGSVGKIKNFFFVILSEATIVV